MAVTRRRAEVEAGRERASSPETWLGAEDGHPLAPSARQLAATERAGTAACGGITQPCRHHYLDDPPTTHRPPASTSRAAAAWGALPAMMLAS